MILSDDMYVPALCWRQGEYQALMRLRSSVKDRVAPLICVPDVEFDFELRQPRKTVGEHVLPFPDRLRSKWGDRPAWITLHENIAAGRMDDGTHVFDYIFDALRPHNTRNIPAVAFAADADTRAAAYRAAQQDQHGLAVILRLEDLMTDDLGDKLVCETDAAGSALEETDLIIDLRAPNFKPYRAFANALITTMRKLGDLGVCRNLVLLSTAIPRTFADVAMGTDQIPRHDWLFYNAFLTFLPPGMRKPVYGDYTIVHPDFAAMDMRKIKSAGKVIYTTPAAWGTRKGGAFRGNEAQMFSHCSVIVRDNAFQFQGSAFSYGDDYIAKCAARQEGPSNLTRWKEVAINHHITLVTDDLAKLAAASLRP